MDTLSSTSSTDRQDARLWHSSIRSNSSLFSSSLLKLKPVHYASQPWNITITEQGDKISIIEPCESSVGSNFVDIVKQHDDSDEDENNTIKSNCGFSALTVVVGVLLVVHGIVNLLLCDQNIRYSWYTCFLVLVVEIIRLVAQKRAQSSERSRVVITVMAAFITIIIINFVWAQVTSRFVRNAITFMDKGKTEYINQSCQSNKTVTLIVSSCEDRAIGCYSYDVITLLSLFLVFPVLKTTNEILKRFANLKQYSSLEKETESVETPYFSSGGQLLLGQTIVFIGFIVSYGVNGDHYIDFRTYLPLVWTGCLVVLGGAVTSAVGHAPNFHNKIAIINVTQVLVIVTSVTNLALHTSGIYQVIASLRRHDGATFTDHTRELLYGSAALFTIADGLMLTAIAWASFIIYSYSQKSTNGSAKEEQKPFTYDNIYTKF